MPLRIRQYAYLKIFSPSMPAEQMAARIGLVPDRIAVRGSRRSDPPRPPQHSWQVVCDDLGVDPGEQFDTLVARLGPHRSALRELVAELRSTDGASAGAVLQVVRYLDDEDGQPGGYQHRLLGWHLGQDVLELATDLGAEIDVDEYGQHDDDYPDVPDLGAGS